MSPRKRIMDEHSELPSAYKRFMARRDAKGLCLAGYKFCSLQRDEGKKSCDNCRKRQAEYYLAKKKRAIDNET